MDTLLLLKHNKLNYYEKTIVNLATEEVERSKSVKSCYHSCNSIKYKVKHAIVKNTFLSGNQVSANVEINEDYINVKVSLVKSNIKDVLLLDSFFCNIKEEGIEINVKREP